MLILISKNSISTTLHAVDWWQKESSEYHHVNSVLFIYRLLQGLLFQSQGGCSPMGRAYTPLRILALLRTPGKGESKSTRRKGCLQADQKDWDEHLACTEFAINSSWQDPAKNTPFFLIIRPLMSVSVRSPRTVPHAHDFVEGIYYKVIKRAKRVAVQACMSQRVARTR